MSTRGTLTAEEKQKKPDDHMDHSWLSGLSFVGDYGDDDGAMQHCCLCSLGRKGAVQDKTPKLSLAEVQNVEFSKAGCSEVSSWSSLSLEC